MPIKPSSSSQRNDYWVMKLETSSTTFPSIMVFLVLLMFALFLAFIRQAIASLVDGVVPSLTDIDNPQLPEKAKVFLLLALNDCHFAHQGSKCFLSTKKFNVSWLDSKYQPIP